MNAANPLDLDQRAVKENDPVPERVLTGIDYADLIVNIESRAVIKGVLPSQAFATIIGGPGSGKTFFMTDLACHVAAGMEWRGKTTEKGLVIFAALEGGANIPNRFVAWKMEHPDAPENLTLRVMSEPVSLRSVGDVQSLIDFTKQAENHHGEACVLICVDTLNRAMTGGDENRSDDMGQLIAGVDRLRAETQATILLTHHTGKDHERGARGHSSLFGAVDTEIAISGSEGHRVATINKQRDGIEGLTFGYTLRQVEVGTDQDGEPVTSCVIEEIEGPVRKSAQIPKSAKVGLAALDESLRIHGITAPPALQMAPSVVVVALPKWRDIFALRYGKEDTKPDSVQKAFKRSKEALLGAEAIRIQDPYVWRT